MAPTVKVTANPETALAMQPNIDVNVSDVFQSIITVKEGGERLAEYVGKVVNGKKTRSEILGEEEIALNRIQPTV